MGAPRKFDEETRARAVRMYFDRVHDLGEPKLTARTYVGQLLGIAPATLRNWVEAQEEAEAGGRPAAAAATAEEVKALRREVAELRRANEILKTASAFFASAELDRRLR